MKPKKQNLKPQFWYEWGDEPAGHVSTGAYDEKNGYVSTGSMPRKEVDKLKLPFNNPHS